MTGWISKLLGLRKMVTNSIVGGVDDAIAILEHRFTVLGGTLANEERLSHDSTMDAEFRILPPLPQLPAPATSKPRKPRAQSAQGIVGDCGNAHGRASFTLSMPRASAAGLSFAPRISPMPCPTCDHTMQSLGAPPGRLQWFWCPRCGTIREGHSEQNPASVPFLVLHARKLVAFAFGVLPKLPSDDQPGLYYRAAAVDESIFLADQRVPPATFTTPPEDQ